MAIDIQTDGPLVLGIVTEALTREKAIALQKDVARIVAEKEMRGFLLDVSQGSFQGSIFDYFELTVKHAKLFPIRMKFAVVISPENFSPSNVQFLQHAAYNRCIPLRIFHGIDAAREWALEL